MTVTEFPDWFSAYAKPNFEKYLIPLAGKRDLRFLQLGVYTGDATVWLQDNVLTHQDTWLFDIDTWEGSDEEVHESLDFNKVYDYYKSRIKERDPVYHYRITTDEFFIQSRWRIEGPFDFIYVDADHTTVGVLLDGEHAWPHLKSGGLLAFDDYQWGAHLPASKSPKLGIDLFLERHAGEYEILEQSLQVWLRKL
jgi:hypothetical protein